MEIRVGRDEGVCDLVDQTRDLRLKSNGGGRAVCQPARPPACDVAKVDGSESWIHGHSVTVLEHVY